MPQPAVSSHVENEDPLLSGAQAAVYLNLPSRKTLDRWRSKGQFADVLVPTRIGRRVKYRKSVLDSFIASCSITPGTTNAVTENQSDDQ